MNTDRGSVPQDSIWTIFYPQNSGDGYSDCEALQARAIMSHGADAPAPSIGVARGGLPSNNAQAKNELPPVHLYRADEWRIVELRYSDEFVGLTETVFSLGNGFAGVRGSFEEGRGAGPRDISLVFGFGGVRDFDGRLSFAPGCRTPGTSSCHGPRAPLRRKVQQHDQ